MNTHSLTQELILHFILLKFTPEQQGKIMRLLEYNKGKVGSYYITTDINSEGNRTHRFGINISKSSLEVYFTTDYFRLLLEYILTNFDILIKESDYTQEQALKL